MTALSRLLFVLAAVLSPLTAQAAPKKSGPGVAIFCPGEYALCIKAECTPQPGAKGKTTDVLCSCSVQHGWSMGPASCGDRLPIMHNGMLQIMSTYSNEFNTLENQNMSCKGSNQPWANCYGATCTVDVDHPERAHCKCPVHYGPMVTLGGGCNKNNCSKMWSAATPAENTFANNNYFRWMTDHGFTTNPPAKVCGAI